MSHSLQRIALAGIAAVGLAGLAPQSAQAQTAVALELSLVIDVSGSVSTTEYNLQRGGYQAAFLNAGIQTSILSFAPTGGVVVNVVQFATNSVEAIGWTLLNSVASINAFAAAIGGMAQNGSIGTATDVQDGMILARTGIQGNAYNGTRKVIDVSGDGHQNTDPACTVSGPSYNQVCAAVQTERNTAALAGIKINGLAIEDGTYGATGLTNWYNTNVRTADGFVVTASGFGNFESAVIEKIGREITSTDTPEPATMAILGISLLGLGLARRRRQAT